MSQYRRLPKVDALARDAALAGFPERTRIEAARYAVSRLREEIALGKAADVQEAPRLAAREAERLTTPAPRLAINLSGVVLHTGLGRARLAGSVAQRVAALARTTRRSSSTWIPADEATDRIMCVGCYAI